MIASRSNLIQYDQMAEKITDDISLCLMLLVCIKSILQIDANLYECIT